MLLHVQLRKAFQNLNVDEEKKGVPIFTLVSSKW